MVCVYDVVVGKEYDVGCASVDGIVAVDCCTASIYTTDDYIVAFGQFAGNFDIFTFLPRYDISNTFMFGKIHPGHAVDAVGPIGDKCEVEGQHFCLSSKRWSQKSK